ncbi:copper amine oxidase [Mitsuokella sp.]|uniref:copper amine oxidase n=1 Tax=unclassified Mitsuokella TaxID=2637239 RepID=UPI003D7F00D6
MNCKMKIVAGLMACTISALCFSSNAMAGSPGETSAALQQDKLIQTGKTQLAEKALQTAEPVKKEKVRKKKKAQETQKSEDTVVRIHQKVAEILREHMAKNPRRNLLKSHMMKIWPVESKDEGGTLLFSDSPESVTEDGILYQDVVQGDARVLYYHLNSSDADKKVAVVLQSMDNQPAIVRVTRGGTSDPSPDYLHVGKMTQMAYFEGEAYGDIYIGRGRHRLLQESMDTTILHPGDLVYGVYDFSTNRPVKVSVIMYPADANPYEFLEQAQVLPKDEQRLRGTFHGMDRVITSEKVYDPANDGIVYFPLADDIHDLYRTGIDATDGSEVKNYGNYGILYKLQIPTLKGGATQYYLSPLGGIYAGAMTVRTNGTQRRMIETPYGRPYFGDSTPPESDATQKAREEGLAILTDDTELADLGSYEDDTPVTFEFSPPGASNLPINIIMMPAE